ncbi:PilZ domain-containing protein [Myxococcota bacterium]|nr:PilZ domain-containing protein [Myxococcota bacterium]
MKRTPILVCSDAGSAGRVLLARRDLDIRWALTVPEAVAVLDSGFPRVLVTREELAGEVLEAARRRDHPVPSIVLLDAEGWARADAHFSRGATALVRESACGRILEAISELTGVPFAQYPRVPYVTPIDAETNGVSCFIESLDLSPSGLTVRGLELPEVGQVVELTFSMLEPPLVATGIVVRTFVEDGESVAGLAFRDLEAVTQARLVMLVEQVRQSAPKLPEPSDFSTDLGSRTLDLEIELVQLGNASAAYRDLLRGALSGRETTVLPSWLRRLAAQLSATERRAVLAEPVPAWAHQTLELRLELGRKRLDAALPALDDSDARRVIDLVCALAVENEHGAPEALVEICEVRASLLREIYGAPSKSRAGLDARRADAGRRSAAPADASKKGRAKRQRHA